MFYLDETLADVAGAEGFVAAGGRGQSCEEEEERGSGGEDQLTRPHPDGSPARHWKHLAQHETQDRTSETCTNKHNSITHIPQEEK